MMFLKMLLIPSVGVSLIFEFESKVFLISTIHRNDVQILLLFLLPEISPFFVP